MKVRKYLNSQSLIQINIQSPISHNLNKLIDQCPQIRRSH
jgi:hypothetical protein